jgi:SOS response regulatory protein OraA/RecX
MEKTLQVQYNLIKEGKGDKAYFLKSAYRLFPDMLSPINTFEDTTRILKNRGVISENIGGLVTTGKKQDWHAIFNENITALKEEKEAKAEEKETTKEVTDMATRGYDYKDEKNYDNIFGEEFLKGYYTEMKDPKNADKHVDELREIVAKNLAKDISYYVKNGQFGVKGLGYTTEAPGLGEPKEAKGKFKSSGYGDLKESVLRLAIQDIIKEVLTETLDKESIKQEGEDAKKDAIKKRIDREKVTRKKKIKALETLTELEGGEDNNNAQKIKELQSEIKQLEGMAAKLDGKKKKDKEVDESLFDLNPTDPTDKPVVATSPTAKAAITKAGGKEIPGTKDVK